MGKVHCQNPRDHVLSPKGPMPTVSPLGSILLPSCPGPSLSWIGNTFYSPFYPDLNSPTLSSSSIHITVTFENAFLYLDMQSFVLQITYRGLEAKAHTYPGLPMNAHILYVR